MRRLLDRPYQLHPSVGLRPERFGALAYHYGTRRLTFLKDPQLSAVVRALARHPDVAATYAALDIPPERQPAFTAALDRLADAEVICERPT